MRLGSQKQHTGDFETAILEISSARRLAFSAGVAMFLALDHRTSHGVVTVGLMKNTTEILEIPELRGWT